MSIRREVRICCDNCGDCTDPEPTATQVVKEARNYGWDFTNGTHLCEDCSLIVDGEQ